MDQSHSGGGAFRGDSLSLAYLELKAWLVCLSHETRPVPDVSPGGPQRHRSIDDNTMNEESVLSLSSRPLEGRGRPQLVHFGVRKALVTTRKELEIKVVRMSGEHSANAVVPRKGNKVSPRLRVKFCGVR